MSRHVPFISVRPLDDRIRLEREARRSLERELSGYATDADRNDLELLLAESGAADGEVVAILSRQAGTRLFRAS